MNTAAPAGSPQAGSPAAHATTGKARHHAGNPESHGGDLFGNLLSLLSSTHETTAELTTGTDTAADEKTHPLHAQGTALDGSQNPLAAMLGWPATPAPGTAAATASSTARATPPGVSLQGMAPLATATATDAATLAALAQASSASTPGAGTPGDALSAETARAASTAAEAAPTASGAPAAPRHLHWRSTAGTAPSTTAQALQAGPPNAPAGDTGTRQALPAQTRSTVALDERFGGALTNPTALATGERAPAAAGASGSAHPDSGSGSPGAAPGQSAPDPLADPTAPNSPEASAYAEATRDADDASAAHWGTPNLRHASLSVGAGTEDAIDIQLSLAGQEVRVDFRTDNAEARASLAQDAGQSLGELLQRSGIQLGSVSVGAQNQQQGEQGRAPEQAHRAMNPGRPTAGNEAASPTAPVVRPRSDGSRPLDLFV